MIRKYMLIGIIAQAEKIGNTREKLQSLALIKDTYNTKMDLLTNASLLQDSIKFVAETKQNLSSKMLCCITYYC